MKITKTISPQTDFLFCLDSDGCVVDSMTWKHQDYFAPLFVKHWDLFSVEKRARALWENVNLYSLTRGINRFQGLLLVLQMLQKEGVVVPPFEDYSHWVNTTAIASNDSLQNAIHLCPNIALQRALDWSCAVNAGIATANHPVETFPSAKKVIPLLAQQGRIAVVSSANPEAVRKEWDALGLADIVVFWGTQEKGSKKEMLDFLVETGSPQQQTLMIGDALGDLQAAKAAGVYFYPILAGKEAESWTHLPTEGLAPFLQGRMEQVQSVLEQQFCDNLNHPTAICSPSTHLP